MVLIKSKKAYKYLLLNLFMIVSSFYKYIEINNLEGFQIKHLDYCKALGIKGKILIGKEGINGSISGTKEQINSYESNLKKNKIFKDLDFKHTSSASIPFRKIIVKIRKEIVTSGLNVNLKNKGKYIEPSKLKELLDKKEDLILLDARNFYESFVGKFKNAITPKIKTFKEFKRVPKLISKYKDKKIVTYCTGGIRCEKASAYLKEKGFKNVFQLHGGIINFINQFPNTYFEGSCFVFDNRLTIPTGTTDISSCAHCKTPSARYINCNYRDCDEMFICCEKCDLNHNHQCKSCINTTQE